MKRWLTTACLATASVVFLAPSAYAQRTPTADSAAVGGDVGLFLPRQDDFTAGLDLFGFYEYYMSSRTSVRLGLEWMNANVDDDLGDGSVRYVRIGGDLVYNWERGAIHPFGGAGLGVYILQLRAGGENVGDSEAKFGGAVFGGFEFFTDRTTAVKAEARYHVVTNQNGFNPDGLSLTIGLKKYF
jgi:hypothetical protein